MRWLTITVSGVAAVALLVAIVILTENAFVRRHGANLATVETPSKQPHSNSSGVDASTEGIAPNAIEDGGSDADGPVDLLAGLDLKAQTQSGDWSVDGDRLSARGGRPQTPARLEFACDLPTEFDYTVTFKSCGARGAVTLVIAAGSRRFLWTVNDSGSGFGLLNGNPALQNRTSRPFSLKQYATHSAVIQVRNGHVAASVDGRQLSVLATDFSDLTLAERWSLDPGCVLGLACLGDIDFLEARVAPASDARGNQLTSNYRQRSADRVRAGENRIARGGIKSLKNADAEADSARPRLNDTDYALWAAARIWKYYHNREWINPDWMLSQHEDLIEQALSSGEQRHVSLAELIVTKDILLGKWLKRESTAGDILNDLPHNMNLTKLNMVLHGIMDDMNDTKQQPVFVKLQT